MADLTPDQANKTVSIVDETTFIEAQVLASTPAGTEGAVVTRNIPSGTQTVSGTVTANQGTPNTAANAWPVVGSYAQGSTTSAQTGILELAAVTTGAPTYSTGQTSPLSLTTAGALRVDASATNQPIVGTLTNNNAAPAANNLGVLPALAEGTLNAARYTTGDQVLLVADLAGNTNVDLQYIAGTAAVTAGVAGLLAVGGNVAAGTADSGNGVKVSGVYNTTVPALTNGERGDIQVDSRSAQQVTLLDGSRQTYKASITNLVAATTPTDVFTITGSATKVVRVTHLCLMGTQTTQATRSVLVIKRSAANTGGTSSACTAVPNDSNNAAATATVLAYTANPTGLGAAVGTMISRQIFIGNAAPGGNVSPIEGGGGDLYEAYRPSQAIVLRGTAQVLAINLNSVTSAGNSFDIFVEWTEE